MRALGEMRDPAPLPICAEAYQRWLDFTNDISYTAEELVELIEVRILAVNFLFPAPALQGTEHSRNSYSFGPCTRAVTSPLGTLNLQATTYD